MIYGRCLCVSVLISIRTLYLLSCEICGQPNREEQRERSLSEREREEKCAQVSTYSTYEIPEFIKFSACQLTTSSLFGDVGVIYSDGCARMRARMHIRTPYRTHYSQCFFSFIIFIYIGLMDFNSRIVLVQIEIVHILLAIIAGKLNQRTVCVCLGRKPFVILSYDDDKMAISNPHRWSQLFVRLLAWFDWDAAVKLF